MAASPRPAGGERRAAAGVALGLAGAALGVSLVRAAAGAQRLEVASLAAGASGSVGARRGAARSLCLDYCAGVGSRDAACDICAVASFVHLHNAYEDAAGKPLGEGYYPYEYLAEVWQPTVFEVDDAVVGAAFLRRVASAAWVVGGGAADVAANGTAAGNGTAACGGCFCGDCEGDGDGDGDAPPPPCCADCCGATGGRRRRRRRRLQHGTDPAARASSWSTLFVFDNDGANNDGQCGGVSPLDAATYTAGGLDADCAALFAAVPRSGVRRTDSGSEP